MGTRYFLLFVCSIALISSSFAQENNQMKPLPLVEFNPNVELPLSQKERGQIQEVFGDKMQSEVLSRPNFLKSIKNILRNRVEIIEFSNPRDQKECTLMSEVPLFDDYVPGLERDRFFNKSTFNPLKYKFNFFSRGSHLYRVDNTNYYILIKSQHKQ